MLLKSHLSLRIMIVIRRCKKSEAERLWEWAMQL